MSSLVARANPSANESSHQQDCIAGKCQGLAQGALNARDADERKLKKAIHRAKSRGAGRDIAGRQKASRATSRRAAARASKRSRAGSKGQGIVERPRNRRKRGPAKKKAPESCLESIQSMSKREKSELLAAYMSGQNPKAPGKNLPQLSSRHSQLYQAQRHEPNPARNQATLHCMSHPASYQAGVMSRQSRGAQGRINGSSQTSNGHALRGRRGATCSQRLPGSQSQSSTLGNLTQPIQSPQPFKAPLHPGQEPEGCDELALIPQAALGVCIILH